MRPVVRSPTRADWPSGSGASPHGAVRQVAMTASSVGAHGSVASADPLGDGYGELPEGGTADGMAPGVLSSGTTARAVSDGCTVKAGGSVEKSAQAANGRPNASRAIGRTRRARRGRSRSGAGTDGITVHGTDPAVGPASAVPTISPHR